MLDTHLTPCVRHVPALAHCMARIYHSRRKQNLPLSQSALNAIRENMQGSVMIGLSHV